MKQLLISVICLLLSIAILTVNTLHENRGDMFIHNWASAQNCKLVPLIQQTYLVAIFSRCCQIHGLQRHHLDALARITKTQLECGRSGATAFEIAYKAMQTMIAAERLSDQFLAKQTG